MKKTIIISALLLCIGLFASCTSSLDLELNKDGSVNIEFNGETGKSLETLIRTSQNIKKDAPIFNTRGIQADLIADGFTKVEVKAPKTSQLVATMKDEKKKTMFFTSGIVSVSNNKLKINLSPRTLVDFYEYADPELSMYLDMLLSPVFNGEEMTETEYLELVQAFYGAAVASDLKKANIVLNLKNPDGTKTSHKISLVTLLTLNKSLQLE